MAAESNDRLTTPDRLHRRLGHLVTATRLALVLDYDGTLVPIQSSPDLASPDPCLLDLLRRLAATPGLTVHIVSGRPRDVLDDWLGALPVELWAEHGHWHRTRPGAEWSGIAGLPDGWHEKVEPILRNFTLATPGSAIESKRASITWHYRLADPQFGARQAHELRMRLGVALSNQPLEVREGKKTLEVRLRGVNKGLVIQHIVASPDAPISIVAAGDDETDEDMFAALAPSVGLGVHIGREPSQAQHSLEDWHTLRKWLELVIGQRGG